MTSDLLSVLAGAVLSLLFSYLPGLSGWYGNLDGDKKRLIMLGMLALVAGGIYALDCAALLIKISPDMAGMCSVADGWVQVLRAFVMAMIANQSAFSISPK